RLVDVALARLREFVGGDRRPQDPVDDRRRPLGRRHVHQRLRYGPVRIPLPPQRPVEGSDDRLRQVDPDGAHAGSGKQAVRVRQLVSEHRTQAAAERAGIDGLLRGERRQYHLHRYRERYRRRRAVDSRRRSAERVRREDAGVAEILVDSRATLKRYSQWAFACSGWPRGTRPRSRSTARKDRAVATLVSALARSPGLARVGRLAAATHSAAAPLLRYTKPQYGARRVSCQT